MSEELAKKNYDLFLEYLKSLNLNSSEKYAKGLLHWSEELVNARVLTKSIFEYENTEEFYEIEKKIKASSLYIQHREDRKTKNPNSGLEIDAELSNYCKFLQSSFFKDTFMTENEKKSLVAFCFSKFNESALNAFNYKTYSEAFDDFSLRISNVKDSYIKRRRDEFDVFFPNNGRVGFQNRAPSPGVKDFFEKWNSYSFEQIVLLIKKYVFNLSENSCSQNLFSNSNFTTNHLHVRYIRSLLSKPFVILTGNSGTGKTRIATRFAQYLEKKNDSGVKNHLLIPVGADWTDNTKILGFYNPLKKEYQSTPVLDFILLAEQNPDIPFFLILDEMNLSHVERYFSDFLSAMESGEPIPLYKKDADCESSIPEKIVLPNNLFVTGTVNIDETTYMFSPKVLDRANVIEFKPEMSDVLENLVSSSENASINPAEPGVAEGFMKLANDVRSGKIPDGAEKILDEMKPILESLYKELEKYGFEFAYRTVKEIRLYTIAAWLTAEGTKPTAIEIADVQILQKILPKIHGNRKQIGELLDNLEKLCTEKELNNSLSKICQMKDHLNRFQYASFI